MPLASELNDELERYLGTDTEQVTDPIRWWHDQKVSYPHLHRMALDYLTIPGKHIHVSQNNNIHFTL